MNEYDLFDAIGGIDNELLTRSDRKALRKFPIRKIFIAAAAVMLLAVTAFANPDIRDWARSFTMTRVSVGEIVSCDEFIGYREGFARVDLNLEDIGETPRTIEELRVPTCFEEGGWSYTEDIRYPNSTYTSYYGIWQRQTDNSLGGQYILYNQKVIVPACAPHPAGYGQFAIDLGCDAQVDETTLTIDDQSYQVYLVGPSSLVPVVEFREHIDVIWTDGAYAYHISSGGMELETLIEVLQSIEPVTAEGYVRDARFAPIEAYYTPSSLPEGWVRWTAEDYGYYASQDWGSNEIHFCLNQHRDQPEGSDVQSEDLEAVLKSARNREATKKIETIDVDGVTVSIVWTADWVDAYWHTDGCAFSLLVYGAPELTAEEIATQIRGLVPVAGLSGLIPE